MKDLLLEDDYDLAIANGDFRIGESETQEVALILQSSKGDWKQDPLCGANLIELMNGNYNKH